MAMLGWTIEAVTAQVFVASSWITPTRCSCEPCGGPSWILMPCSTPGRSGVSRSSARPSVALARNEVQPSSPPTAYIVEANTQPVAERSEEHTSELQSLMRISYAVFCLKKKYNDKTGNRETSTERTASVTYLPQ